MRRLARSEDDGEMLQPPRLAEPHPMPLTMAYLDEGLKRLRAVNASASQSRLTTIAVHPSSNPPSPSAKWDARGGPRPTDSLLPTADGADWTQQLHLTALGLLRRTSALVRWRVRPPKYLWRGLSNSRCTDDFLHAGGTELGAMSTTEDIGVAMRYARASGDSALVFRIAVPSFLQEGCSLGFLSAFEHEAERLYPPLTYLRPIYKEPRAELWYDGLQYTCVDVEPNFPS